MRADTRADYKKIADALGICRADLKATLEIASHDQVWIAGGKAADIIKP